MHNISINSSSRKAIEVCDIQGIDARATLLTAAFRYRIDEPNIKAGYERYAALTGGTFDMDTFRTAVADCLRDQLIREPIRLPEGALQCHWRLELTPKGVAAVRSLPDAGA
jgi:hypothetical protein